MSIIEVGGIERHRENTNTDRPILALASRVVVEGNNLRRQSGKTTAQVPEHTANFQICVC